MTNTVVPPFDHRDDGTAESVWADSPVLGSAGVFDLSGMAELVVVGAHPDDETLGAGGLLATATRLGIDVTVVIATMGERSHPGSPTHPPGELAALRRTEVFAALGFLAPTATVVMLGLPDGDLARHQDALADRIRPFVHGASTVVAAPWQQDGHPDHTAAGNAAAQAVAGTGGVLLEYPVWAWHWSTPANLPGGLRRINLEPEERAVKQHALQCHRSQIEPLSDLPGDEAILAPGFAEHFERPYEIFIATTGDPATDGPVEDRRSLRQDFFDDFYTAGPDPWGFESRWYERRKRAVTIAALPRESFRNAFEPGCSIGVLTAELAPRCDRLLATDISDRPLAAARRRLGDAPGVRFEQRRIPQEWPAGSFDLVVLSEVGYYCGEDDLRTLVARASSSLTTDGVLVACHWRHPVSEYPLTGDDVHRALTAERSLAVLAEHIEEDFVLHVFTPSPAISVARATGLLR